MGARDGHSLRDTGRVATALSVGFALLASAVFLIVPETLLGLFLNPSDPERPAILAIGVSLMVVAALFQMMDGAQVTALGLLRGQQDTRAPMVFAALSYWGVGVPVSYLLGFVLGFGAVGVWLGLVVGLACAAVLLMWRFWTRGIAQLPLAAAPGLRVG
jgi:MATE family multidrug resistance protein